MARTRTASCPHLRRSLVVFQKHGRHHSPRGTVETAIQSIYDLFSHRQHSGGLSGFQPSMAKASPESRFWYIRGIVATDYNLNLQRLGHAVNGQRSCKFASDMQPYLCHDGRHLVAWLVRGELTGNATPPIGMQIERTHSWLLPGNQTNSKSPRSCRCARCVFCSTTRPHPRHRHYRKHTKNKWKTNKRLTVTFPNSK